MSNYIHDPSYRARMRELIQGFIEHCEVSPTLLGRIERFVHLDGRKYGVPVFTIFGPPHDEMETQFVGLGGVNDGQYVRAGETLLQLIERLAVQPNVAQGHVLRILPVTDPVGLELDEPVGPRGHQTLEGEPLDGLIELHVSGGETFAVTAHGPVPVLQAVRAAEEVLRRLAGEEPGDRPDIRSRLLEDEGPWRLSVQIPAGWSSRMAVQWGSQFLVVFFRSHAAMQSLAQAPQEGLST